MTQMLDKVGYIKKVPRDDAPTEALLE